MSAQILSFRRRAWQPKSKFAVLRGVAALRMLSLAHDRAWPCYVPKASRGLFDFGMLMYDNVSEITIFGDHDDADNLCMVKWSPYHPHTVWDPHDVSTQRQF